MVQWEGRREQREHASGLVGDSARKCETKGSTYCNKQSQISRPRHLMARSRTSRCGWFTLMSGALRPHERAEGAVRDMVFFSKDCDSG
jgi:hypothetical protein